MKKILASLLAITMLMTTMSACIIPASAEDAAVATSYIYNEDFNEYATDVNWLLNTDDNSFVTGLGEGKENTWSVYGYGYLDETDSTKALGTVKVVTESTATGSDTGRGNVLRIDVNGMAADASKAGKNWIHVKANANGSDGIARAAMADGKKLVLSTDVFVPSTRTGAYETGLMRYMGGYKNDSAAASMNYGKISVGSNINASTSIYAIMNGTNWGYYGFTRTSKSIGGKWVTLKRIVDVSAQTSAERPADTTRFIHDGALMTVKVATEGITTAMDINSKFKYAQGTEIIDTWQTAFKGTDLTSTLPDFYGVSFSNAQPKSATASTNTEYFIDNVKAYWIDAFKQEGTITYGDLDENGNYYKGQIEIPFNNEIAETVTTDGVTAKTWALTDLLYLVDEDGSVVEGGIASAELSDDNKTLLVTPKKGLEAGKKFTITADARFSDVELQGLSVTGEASETTELASFTMGVDPYAHIYFDEDFEDYTSIIGVNWASSVDTSTNYVTLKGVEEKAWKIGSSAGTSSISSGSVKVVTDPKTSGRGNVLEIDTGSIASGKNITVLKTPGASTISRSTMNGKRIVFEGDIYIPANSTLDEDTTFAYYSGANGMNTSRPNSYIFPYNSTSGSSLYTIGSGAYGTITSGRSKYSAGGEWHTYRYVVDVSGTPSADRVDTVRGYIDGNLMVGVLSEGTTTAATNANYPIYEADGTTPLQIVDFWKRTGVWDSTSANNYSAGDFYGVFMAARTNGGTVNKYYVDNMTAYYVDDLALTVPDLSDFTGGGINLTFNQKIPEKFDILTSEKTNLNTVATEKTLADMFTILDKDGNDVDGIKSATVSADGKTVTILPQNIEANSDYTLVISRYFRDAEGQGLTKNSTEYEIDMHVGEFVPFELVNISQTSVSGFAQGRDVKVTAEFSMNISDDMITDGIVVTDSEGNTVARNAGWTATIDAENAKVVVFDFTNLPTDSYTVTANENFAIAGEALSNTLKITIEAAAQPIELFNETFDTGYTADENWIKAANAVTDGSLYNGLPYATATAYYKSYTVGNHDWDIQLHWATTAGTAPSDDALNVTDFIGVVAAPSAATAKMSGNALKIYSNRGSNYAYDYVSFRRNFNKLNGIDFSSEAYKGKKLVYEADIYADSIAGDNSFFVPFAASSTKGVRDYADWMMLFSSGGLRAPGTYKNPFSSYGPIAMYAQVNTNSIGNVTTAPVNYKMVVSMGDNIDTLAYYVNGTLVQRSEAAQAVLKGHEYNDSARHEFTPSDSEKALGENLNINDVIYGIWGLVGQGASTARTVYVDNFKAYLVDEFKVESVSGYGDVFNTAKGAVTYTFSKAVNANKAVANETIVLLDAEGNAVAGGIESVTLADGDYQMIVKLSETLPGNTKYTIKLTEGLQDVDGLPLSTEWKEYKYPIDDYYKGTDNVYTITDVAGTAELTCTYTPATTSTPAYLTYSGHKVAVDTYVRNADAMKMYVNLTTSKATSLFADATATNESGVVTVNATFTNPETDVMPVWAVVAVYGEYNEMLGCTIANVTSINAGSTADDTITVNVGDSSKVKTVKLHVWNSYDAMVPYHKAETLISK